jgi:hypothetical protein
MSEDLQWAALVSARSQMTQPAPMAFQCIAVAHRGSYVLQFAGPMLLPAEAPVVSPLPQASSCHRLSERG